MAEPGAPMHAQDRARHAVTAPRPNPGRARTPPCPVALVLPSPCPLARAITTPPATYWTCSLARGRLVTVAMIRARPHPYCQHSIVASPPQTPFSRAVKLTSTARMPATLRGPYLAPSPLQTAAPWTTSTGTHSTHAPL